MELKNSNPNGSIVVQLAGTSSEVCSSHSQVCFLFVYGLCKCLDWLHYFFILLNFQYFWKKIKILDVDCLLQHLGCNFVSIIETNTISCGNVGSVQFYLYF